MEYLEFCNFKVYMIRHMPYTPLASPFYPWEDGHGPYVYMYT